MIEIINTARDIVRLGFSFIPSNYFVIVLPACGFVVVVKLLRSI